MDYHSRLCPARRGRAQQLDASSRDFAGQSVPDCFSWSAIRIASNNNESFAVPAGNFARMS